MTVVKCVIWDLDNTLLSGVFLESAQQPPAADPAMLAAAAQLGARGIIHAVASKNPPEAADHAAKVTGLRFAAAECGWGRKSESVQRIMTDLGMAADAVAFVDDDPYERAEVSFALPGVLVLSPEDMNDAVGWPEFSPAAVTPEARRRGEMYAARRRRLAEARAFAGSAGEFAAYSAARLTIARATAADVPRLHELSVRTHQFNSRGEAVPEAALAAMVASPAHRVATVRLSDRFGDDGMVGASVAVPQTPEPQTPETNTWTVELLMMSCRAMGRGVIEVVLTWLVRSAARDGAGVMAVPCLISPRNVPLRLALTGAGFRAGPGSQPGRPAVFSRPLTEPLAEPLHEPLPSWVTAPDEW